MTLALRKRAYEDSNSEFEDHEPLLIVVFQREFRFKLLVLSQKYNAMLDPSDDVANYHAAMKLQDATDNILCRVFSKTSERGQGANTTDSFQGPYALFTSCIMGSFNNLPASRIIKISIASLTGVEQAPSESLCQFLQHFKEKKLHKEKCFSDIVLTTLISRVRHIALHNSIGKRKHTLLHEHLKLFDKRIGLVVFV